MELRDASEAKSPQLHGGLAGVDAVSDAQSAAPAAGNVVRLAAGVSAETRADTLASQLREAESCAQAQAAALEQLRVDVDKAHSAGAAIEGF